MILCFGLYFEELDTKVSPVEDQDSSTLQMVFLLQLRFDMCKTRLVLVGPTLMEGWGGGMVLDYEAISVLASIIA